MTPKPSLRTCHVCADEIKEGTFDTYYADIGTDNPVHWAKVEACAPAVCAGLCVKLP